MNLNTKYFYKISFIPLNISSGKKAVLFVCHENIYRSSVCEGICKNLVGNSLYVSSAATSFSYTGRQPDTRSQQICKQNGIDISKIRAKQIIQSDFDRFDVIAALDKSTLENILSIQPTRCRAKIVLFNPPRGIDDPLYHNNGFPTMFTSISKEMKPFLTQYELI